MGGRQEKELLAALDSPIRQRILVLAVTGDLPAQPSASSVKEKLKDEFSSIETQEVHYHLTRLQDGGLLPRPLLPGA